MSEIEIWHHFFEPGETVFQGGILAALARVGVRTHPLDPAAKGPRVMFFDRVTPQLCEFLRDVSRSGLERVLAVALSRGALADVNAWALLQHGAADAFEWEHTGGRAMEIAARFQRWEVVDQLVRSALVRNSPVGQSSAWIRILRKVVEVARFTDDSVLLTAKAALERSWSRA